MIYTWLVLFKIQEHSIGLFSRHSVIGKATEKCSNVSYCEAYNIKVFTCIQPLCTY